MIGDWIAASRLRDLAVGPTQDVVDALYGGAAFDARLYIADSLQELCRELPVVQDEIAVLCDQVTDTNMRLIALRAGLLAARDETIWLHFRIAYLLNTLGGIGITDVELPILVHSLLALARIDHAPDARPFLSDMVSRYLVDLSSLDCYGHVMGAIDAGSESAIWPLLRLDVRETRDYSTGADLKLAERHRERLGRSVFGRRIDPEPIHVGPPSTATFAPPAHGSEHFVFRADQQNRTRPEVSIYAVQNGTVSVRLSASQMTEVYVFDRDGRLLPDMSVGLRPFRADAKHVVQGRLAVLSDQFCHRFNICHFLLDHLTRTKLYEETKRDVDHFLIFQDNEYMRRAATLAGIGDQLLPITTTQFEVSADEILISSNLARDWRHPAQFGDPALLALYDGWGRHGPDDASVSLPGGGRWLYISRSDATARRLLNQDEIGTLLSSLDFDTVALSDYSLEQQISLFSRADAVVGVHGAGLTNVVFGRPSLKVLEIIPPMVATDAYWILARARHQHYDALIGRDPVFGRPDYAHWTHRPELNDRDMHVDVAELRETLEQLLAH